MGLTDYWHRDKGSKKEILKHFGSDFEKQLLLNLGYAARIYPKVWDAVGAGYFSLHSIIKYQYSLSIGGEIVTEDEWRELVNAKTPLVNFRGAWVELDRDKMKQMLEFWQSHSEEKPEMGLLDMMKMASLQGDELEFEHDEALSDMMGKLSDRSRLDIIEDPPRFTAL